MDVSLNFANLHLDGDVASEWDAILKLNGDLSIRLLGEPFYEQSEFPVLEFVLPLARWLLVVEDAGPPFVYTSTESEVEGLIEFQPGVTGRWQVTAREPDFSGVYVAPVLVGTESLRTAGEDFVKRLGPAIRTFFDPSDYLRGPDVLLLRRFWS